MMDKTKRDVAIQHGTHLASGRAQGIYLSPGQGSPTMLRRDGSTPPSIATIPISLGIFSYLNIQPVYYGLLHEQEKHDDINLVMGVPTRLNTALLRGEVDLSCVSGHAYAEYCSEFRLIPHLSISAPGAVESVLLCTRYDDWGSHGGKNICYSN